MQNERGSNRALWFFFAAVVVVVVLVALFSSNDLFHSQNAAPTQPTPHAIDQSPGDAT
ncbi:hypothetical protein [Rhizobium sp. G21]|uniref:hypothetical protein n=1 Tax=Rhizobium sp. G21 TaxID=2758439 RepID=UPI001602BAB5|nr:hypothetical protein [Rhizobium sp. G21]MBB1249118.1 hypothetical protein [Rhizobium sp. G21]